MLSHALTHEISINIGLISNYFVLPMTIWIAIQLGYTLLAVCTPMYFKRLKNEKWKKRVIHIVSVVAGVLPLLFASLLTLGLGGYTPADSKFPPVVCFARNRDISAYTLLVPLGVVMATVFTELILIFHYLIRLVIN